MSSLNECSSNIPIIDISCLFVENPKSSALDELTLKWDNAFRTVGFAIITGHGVNLDAIEALYTKANTFFHLPKSEKLKYCKNQKYGGDGYIPMGIEAVGRTHVANVDEIVKTPADLVESFVFHDTTVDDSIPTLMKSELQVYFNHMNQLLRRLMTLSARALKLPENYFDSFYEQPESSLRLAFYPQCSFPPLENQMRYAPHTDYQGFTILKQDYAVGGLEVLLESGEWTPVVQVKDSLVINAGDLIELWTNGVWKSNLHRVVNPTSPENNKSRLSMVFFTGPNGKSIVSPLESCIREKNGKVLYSPVSVADHLSMKLNVSNTV